MNRASDKADTVGARRRRLEALRDDCRRHQGPRTGIKLVEGGRLEDLGAVALWTCHTLRDGRGIQMALYGATFEAGHDARAFLHRIGDLLDETTESADENADFAHDPTNRAMFTLAMRGRGRSAWTAPSPSVGLQGFRDSGGTDPEKWFRENGWIRKTSREVPDVLAAIAELCDELLLEPSAPKRVDAEEFIEPTGNRAKAIWELDALEPGALLKTAVLAARLQIGSRRAARVLGELKEEGWRIVSVSGPGGGARLGDSQSEKQREWLVRTRP